MMASLSQPLCDGDGTIPQNNKVLIESSSTIEKLHSVADECKEEDAIEWAEEEIADEEARVELGLVGKVGQIDLLMPMHSCRQ